MTKKRVRTILIVVLVLAVLALAVWLIARQVRSGTVNVYAVSDVAEGYYNYEDELEGMVTEGSVETVPLDEGLVSSIAVKVGDKVKQGDLLLTYDTSSYQLTLSSDQADIAMLQSEITQAQRDITSLRNMTPAERVTPPPTPTPKPAPKTVSVVAPETKPAETKDGRAFYNCTAQTVVQGKTLAALRTDGTKAAYRIYDGRDLLGVWYVSGATLSKNYDDDWTPKDWTLGEGLTLNGDGTVTVDFTKTHYGSFRSEIPDTDDDDSSWFDPTDGHYTSAEIQDMIREKNAEIASFQQELKQAQLKYQRDKLTGKSGEVRAKNDGTVTSVADPHAISVGEALITVRGSTRASVTVYVDELSLDVLQPGDGVSVYSYESGNSFTATVEKVGTKPADDYYYYGANSSYYPVTCIADDEGVDLNMGEYCSVTLDTESASSDALYLPLFFVREDSDGSYVFAQGADGRLERRAVSTGAILWGSSVEIRKGLTMEDYVAFPYGRGVQAGNRTQAAGLDELYNYY